MRSPHDFSSMTALICFEAAARNGSFKVAADEMNVTASAISHQIKLLERDLGCMLFNRRHRGVELTERGAFLLVAVRRGFEGITDAIGQLRARPENVDVTLRATTAVSALWLMPRIRSFWKLHPSVSVSQIVSDVVGSDGRSDIAVGYALPEDNGHEWHELFRDRILALGSPDFVARHDVSTLAELAAAPLIHVNHSNALWAGWSEWFAHLGCPAPVAAGFFVNNHMIALQAAEDSVGAVLGWEGLASGLLRSGRLVALMQDSVPSHSAFTMQIHPHASAKARLFADWLAANV